MKIYIPPLELASTILKTLFISAVAQRHTEYRSIVFGFDVELGLEFAEIEGGSAEGFAQDLVTALKQMEGAVRSSDWRIPIVGRMGRSEEDVGILKKVFEGTDVDVQDILRSRKDAKPRLYHELTNLLNSSRQQLARSLSIADHRSGRNVTVLIGESRDRDAVKIPRLLFREAFYECGRFGGVKDTPRKGSPKMGKVEVLLGRGFAALTLAAMIAYNTCSTDVGETTHHLFTLISPGSTTLTARDCMFLNTAYSRLRSFTPCILVDDVEMLRLAMLFKLYSESVVQLRMILAGSPGIESIAFQVVSVIPTGYRFYRDFTVGVQLGEVSSLDLSFKTLGFESGAEELAEKLSRLMTAAARLSSVFGGAGAVERLKHELKMIAYGVASANLKLYKESVYGALRILESNDIFWGLTDQMASELRRRAELDQRIVDEYLEREYVGKYGGDKNLALRMSEAHRLRMLMSTLAGLV